MQRAIQAVGDKANHRPLRFIAIGGHAPLGQARTGNIDFLPHRDSLAECYQASDAYLHAAKADTFPTTVLEALACGKPVVATSVGGIPEQIIDGQTGFLAPAGDADSLACHLLRLLKEPGCCSRMGEAAAIDAKERFTLTRMVTNYAALYAEALEGWTGRDNLFAANSQTGSDKSDRSLSLVY